MKLSLPGTDAPLTAAPAGDFFADAEGLPSLGPLAVPLIGSVAIGVAAVLMRPSAPLLDAWIAAILVLWLVGPLVWSALGLRHRRGLWVDEFGITELYASGDRRTIPWEHVRDLVMDDRRAHLVTDEGRVPIPRGLHDRDRLLRRVAVLVGRRKAEGHETLALVRGEVMHAHDEAAEEVTVIAGPSLAVVGYVALLLLWPALVFAVALGAGAQFLGERAGGLWLAGVPLLVALVWLREATVLWVGVDRQGLTLVSLAGRRLVPWVDVREVAPTGHGWRVVAAGDELAIPTLLLGRSRFAAALDERWTEMRPAARRAATGAPAA